MMKRNPVVAMLIAIVMCRPAAGWGQATLPATQPAMKLIVSEKGDIAISLGGKSIATGHWTAGESNLSLPDADQVALGAFKSSSARQDSPTHAQVIDNYANATSTTDIKLDGEDLRLGVHLQNLDTTRSMKNIELRGLTFYFARNASGTLRSWHISYLAHEGIKLFHPGLQQPLGEVFAHDDQFGFGVFSGSEFDRQSMFIAEWQKDGLIPAECLVDFYTRVMIPPGQAVDVDTNFRISSNFSIPHLFENYKKTYTAHFPALLFHPDARPVVQFAGVGGNLVTDTNPRGFGGDFRRLDSALGAATYAQTLAPTMTRADALGIIFWSPGGYTPPMYPPDFDQFPPSVQVNIPVLVNGFKRHGLRVGLCARCGDGVIREKGKQPVVYRLSASDTNQMETLMDRFGHAMKMGFDLFYLDSFGCDNPNDMEILKQVRAKVGMDVQLYTEYCTDMSLPYAGHYCEWRGLDLLWTSEDLYNAMRFLCPDSPWLCISRTHQPVPAAFAKLGLTPLVEDANAAYLPPAKRKH